MIELLPLWMFIALCLVLMLGYPVAFSLAGTALLFASGGILSNIFDPALLGAFPSRIFGTMTNATLTAVPLFVFMGVTLERTRIAEGLLQSMSSLFGNKPGGLGIAVIVVGALLAASTGIVGATVVTMGLLSLPTMLNAGYSPRLAAGTICATGTLGQIIPPSIALILLGDTLSNAYQQSQLTQGNFNSEAISIGDLFVAALGPGLLLVAAYSFYLLCIAKWRPQWVPSAETTAVSKRRLLRELFAPISLIIIVLGSILSGIATPSEAAAMGALGSLLLALAMGKLSLNVMREVCKTTLDVSAMVFMILIGATLFSLVFRGFGGEEMVQGFFEHLPGGRYGALFVVMLFMFLLGFILDFIEITFVVVPIVGPILMLMGFDPIWLGILIAINLQTSFLTPPFGFALFYLRGVAPSSLATSDIYRGVIPFIIIQWLLMATLVIWPDLATWLPSTLKN
ncbi:MAG TPA: TRAP transporter large permease subunit [Pseudomonadales bacterium]|nr:TRAP transporter large permease subunit [Pseudomonadales bacterium]